MMAEDSLLFPGYLYQTDMTDKTGDGQAPYPYPYAHFRKYDLPTALQQGTLFPWLDDHWQARNRGTGEAHRE